MSYTTSDNISNDNSYDVLNETSGDTSTTTTTDFQKELKDRDILEAIRDRFKEKDIKTLLALRKLTLTQLKEYFEFKASDASDESETVKASAIDRKHLKALWSGDASVTKDYVPPIRKQIMQLGVSDKYVDYFENKDIFDLEDVTEESLKDASSWAESISLKNVKSDIRKIRLKANLDSNKAIRDDPEKKIWIKNKKFISGELDKLIGKAKTMEGSVETILKDLEPEKMDATTRKDLMAKLKILKTETKGLVPAEMDQVGKLFKGISAFDELDQERLFGATKRVSYKSHEDIVAYASGGQARCGFHIDLKDQTIDPCDLPLLEKPLDVESLGVTTPLCCNVVKTISETESNTFVANASSFGVSTATEMHDTFSTSAAGFFGFGGASVTRGRGSVTKEAEAEYEEERRTKYITSNVSSVQLIEYMSIPMRSFRIPRTQMKLSKEALYELKRIGLKEESNDESNEESKQEKEDKNVTLKDNDIKRFLERFGSHVTNAKRTYGGIFFRKITLDSKKETEANKLFEMAGEQLQKIKKETTKTEGGAFSTYGLGGVSITKTKSEGSSRTEDDKSVEIDNSSSAENTVTYCSTIKASGPNATTPEDFKRLLDEDNKSWAIMDSEKIKKYLVPVWDLIRDHSDEEDNKIHDKVTNKKLAKSVEEAWLKGIDDDVKRAIKTGKSFESIIAEKSIEKRLWEDLSEIIFRSGGGTRDKDLFDLDALNKVVGLAARRIADREEDDKKTHKRQDWIEEFFNEGINELKKDTEKGNSQLNDQLNKDAEEGNGQLNKDTEEASVKRFLRAHNSNPDRQENDLRAYTIATNTFIQDIDWIHFPDIFKNHASQAYKNRSPRFEGLPSGISGVKYLGQYAHFFSGKNCYKWDLEGDKFHEQLPTSSVFHSLFAKSTSEIKNVKLNYDDGKTRAKINSITGLDPINGEVDAVLAFRSDESGYPKWNNKSFLFQGKLCIVWENTKNYKRIGYDMKEPKKLEVDPDGTKAPTAFWDIPKFDAALSTDQDDVDDSFKKNLYVFSGNEYYEVAYKKDSTASNMGLISGGLKMDFPITKIDAVFTYPKADCPSYAKGIAYIFSGDKYYLYDLKNKKSFSERGYPIHTI